MSVFSCHICSCRYYRPQLASLPAQKRALSSSASSRTPRHRGEPLRELASLPPATTRLDFRSIPYGSSPHLLFPPRGVPQANFTSPYFTLRCFPSPSRGRTPRPLDPDSLRHSPTPPPSFSHLSLSLTPDQQRARQTATKYAHKAYTMDLSILVSKAKVHKSAVVRERCKRRLREAIRIVVLQGAKAGNGMLTFHVTEEGPRRWLVPGFSYVSSATLELYRMPFPDLVTEVRWALERTKEEAESRLNERRMYNLVEDLPELNRPPEMSSNPHDN